MAYRQPVSRARVVRRPRGERRRRDAHAGHPRPGRGGRHTTPRPAPSSTARPTFFLERIGLTQPGRAARAGAVPARGRRARRARRRGRAVSGDAAVRARAGPGERGRMSPQRARWPRRQARQHRCGQPAIVVPARAASGVARGRRPAPRRSRRSPRAPVRRRPRPGRRAAAEGARLGRRRLAGGPARS